MTGTRTLRFALTAIGLLPAPVLAALGCVIGAAGYALMGRRRRIAHANLRLCFPSRSAAWRTATAAAHFMLFARFVLDHGLMLTASRQRLQRLVRLHGREHLRPDGERPLLVVAAHFLGLEFGGSRISMEGPLDAGYQPQHSAAFEDVISEGRRRICPGLRLHQVGTVRGLRGALAGLREGRTLYYLPDMDVGHRGKSVFIPLLGANAAAVSTALPRIARASGARVVGCAALLRPWGGYDVHISEPWEGFPGDDDEEALLQFHKWLEPWLSKHPAQYYLMHRRFKTQPPGAPDPYA